MKKRVKKGSYTQPSQGERDRLEAMLLAGHKQKEIAQILGRDLGTISREIKRNKKKFKQKSIKKVLYKATLAQSKAIYRRKTASHQGMKIERNDKLRRYIISTLSQGWSPDEIAGRLKEKKKGFYASKNLIYRWLYSPFGQKYCKLLYSKRYHAKKRKKKVEKSLIPSRVSIDNRPGLIESRLRYGDFEGDTVVSGKKTGSKVSLVVIIERKSRYIRIRKISSLKPALFISALKELKKEMKSLTLDNGIENRKHQELKIPTFFCHPYSSWQKGGVENGNKLIRRYIPKGTDIGSYSQEDIRKIENLINKKPRKILGYKSAFELMSENAMFN